jgi:predicted transcriptional regulator
MADVKDIRNPSLMIRISPDMNDRLDRVAEMYGVTRGEVARIAIGQYVGQITGAIDQMVKTSQAQSQALDVEKMIEAMIPKMIEAFSEGEKKNN